MKLNNKGFTLIELLMVIAILVMLALFATPNVVALINKNKVDNYNSTIDSIIEAAEVYVSDNRYDNSKLSFSGACNLTDMTPTEITATISLRKLIDSKNITSPVKNFCTDKDIDNDTEIIVTLNCNTRQFSYDIDVDKSHNTLNRKTGVAGIDGIKIITSCDELY